jgi:uncharacterized delta-60 repeat protein
VAWVIPVSISAETRYLAAGFDGDSVVMIRLMQDGLIDTSFASIQPVDFDNPDNPVDSSGGYALALQSSGRALVAGYADTDTTGASDFSTAYRVTALSDGSILVGGYSTGSGKAEFIVAKFDAVGLPISGFGSGGIARARVSDLSGEAHAIAVQSNGKIIVAGKSWDGTNTIATLVRFTSTGALDTEFAQNGIFRADIGDSDSRCYGLVIQSDGGILFCGHAEYQSLGDTEFFMQRLWP